MTAAQIAAHHEVHSNPVATVKTQLQQNAAGIFGGHSIAEDGRERIRELHEKIGELTVERVLFKRRAREVPPPERQALIERGA